MCAESSFCLSHNRLTGIALLAICFGLVIAAVLTLRHQSEQHPTAGLDLASFEAYGNSKDYWGTWTAVHSAQSIVGSIVAKLIGDRRVRQTATTRRQPEPIESDRKIRLVGASFYDIDGAAHSLSSVIAIVRNATRPGRHIPPVLHYFLRRRLTRMQSVCMRSAVQHVQPVRIFIWLRSPIDGGGIHWRRLLASADINGWGSKIIVAINRFAGELSSEAEYQLEMLDALLVFGGIALDPDVFALKSPQSLLQHRLPVLGRNVTGVDSCGDVQNSISVDVVLSAPMSPLLFLWRLAILHWRDLSGGSEWGSYDSGLLLRLFVEALPDRVHKEGELFLCRGDKSDDNWRSGFFVRVP